MVLEVGLGGELDSTNVLDETSLSILTSVQLDVRQLGSTVEEIAVKKAGIIKREVPSVGPGTPLGVLRRGEVTQCPCLRTLRLAERSEV